MKKRLFSLFVGIVAVASLMDAAPTKSLTFNGTNQYVQIPNNADLLMASNESLSISLWVKSSGSLQQGQRFLGLRNSNVESNTGYEMYSLTGGYACTTTAIPGSTGASARIMDAVLGGSGSTWVHLAIVFDRAGGASHAYLNGTEVTAASKSISSSNIINTTQDILFGAGWMGSTTAAASNFFDGNVANIRFYKGVLSASQVVSDMNTNDYSALDSAIKNICVAAYEPTDEFTSLTLSDLTGNGHDGVLKNYTLPVGDGRISSVTVTQNTDFTGRKNAYDVILKTAVVFTGTSEDFNSLNITLNGTTKISDYSKVKIYSTGTASSFDERTASAATLLGEYAPAAGTITCNFTSPVKFLSGTNYVWVVAEVAANAVEGNKLDATIESITTAKETYAVTSGAPDGDREILLARKLLYAPGDGGSVGYRIPSMVILPNGNIVTAIDRRWNNEGDLANRIDIISNISQDGGYTWGDINPIATATSTSTGRGDVAMAAYNNDTIIAAFVGDNGLGASTSSNPISSYISRSFDGGITWTPVVKGGQGDITKQIWGTTSGGDYIRTGATAAFFGSGRGIVLQRQTGANAYKNGRIMFVTAVRYNGSLYNYAVYSDDKGETWKVSGLAFSYGDEAKVAEMSDGTILMSIRRSGQRGYNRSTDGGETWGSSGTWSNLNVNACNGDILEYTTLSEGYEKNRTIQSLPINDGSLGRTKVSIYLSYDEGQTWARVKQLFPSSSGYSTMVMFDDGTIGIYAEEQTSGTRNYFMRFSLSWLTDGQDVYTPIATVKSPTFTPADGTAFEEGTTGSIAIACATAGSTIYYTTDGTTPSIENGTIYRSPIDITTTTEIKAIAVKDELSDSNVATAKYTFEKYYTMTVNVSPATAGSVTINGNSSPQNVANGSNVEFIATPATGYTFVNWTEGTTIKSTSAKYTISDVQGEYTLIANFKKDPKLSREGWSAKVDCYSESTTGSDGPADAAIDGNLGRWWHSQYSPSTVSYNHWIQFDLGSSQSFNEFNYVSRSGLSSGDNSNGNVSGYSLYVSDTDISANLNSSKVPTNATLVNTGTFSYTGNAEDRDHIVSLGSTVTGRYVFLLCTSSANGQPFAGCNEFYLYLQPEEEGHITGVTVTQVTGFTGRKNAMDPIIKAAVSYRGTAAPLNTIDITLNGTTNINDYAKVKVYSTGTTSTFDERDASSATFLGEFTPQEGTITCNLTSKDLVSGTNYLWIVAQVADNAIEGNKLDATIESITTANETYTVTDGDPDGYREILLAYKTIYKYGDMHDGEVHSWRIPAMVILPNGNLVIAQDRRPYPTESDLPNDISILSHISTDGGYSWSGAKILAQGGGTTSNGRGDVALAAYNNDTIIAAFVGDNGLSASTASNPISSYISRSFDGGLTWTPVVKGGQGDITNTVFSGLASTKKAAFFGSGRGLVLSRQTGANANKNGRIMFVTAGGSIGSLLNYIVYSDDRGETWKMSELAFNGGDEAKVAELNDGTILISVRRGGARGYNKSTDGGETWGSQGTWSDLVVNACNGDILEYTTLTEGFEKNRTLHSLPTNTGSQSREKVSMYISYDEGETWSNEKQLFNGPSGYSTMVKFDDGTIGLYVEEQTQMTPSITNLIFMRFSLKWMTDGKDEFSPVATDRAETPTFDPASGTIFDSGETGYVTISCATPNSTIYYTIDGTTPSPETGIEYTTPVEVTYDMEIRAMATAKNLTNSLVGIAKYSFPSYCTRGDEVSSHAGGRKLTSIALTGGEESFIISDIETVNAHPIYHDYTDRAFTVKAGREVTPNITWNYEWMHAYLYIDYNKDKKFSYNINEDGTPGEGSEIVSYSYYDAGEATTGRNSKGEMVGYDTGVTSESVPSFTIPSDLENGEYRMRVKIDWCSIDPCADEQIGSNSIAKNGGSMVDFTVNVTGGVGVEDVINGDDMYIYGAEGKIVVNNCNIANIEIFDASGRIVKSAIINGNGFITIDKGFYIVRGNGKSIKVVVK